MNLPSRSSLSPDAAFYIGKLRGGSFLQGAPVFAAEVRNENDYRPPAERAMADKRRDYSAAGTLVVWDVDVLRDQVVRRDIRRYTAGVKSPRPNPRCPVGPCRWT
ncbi:MAG: Uma2 family endonuclease, partial [Gammaproteobacteria bacterium]